MDGHHSGFWIQKIDPPICVQKEERDEIFRNALQPC